MPVRHAPRASTSRKAALAPLLKIICILLILPGVAQAAATFAGPEGWRIMCADTPGYCNTTPASPLPPLDEAEIARLAAVNAAVNDAIAPLDEPPGVDVWRLAPAFGDCEDYALTKKHRLIETGFPVERLRFATVITEAGEYHAVLMVEHGDRRLVLDNRFATPRDWAAVEAEGYRLVALEGLGQDGAWQLTPYGTVLALVAGAGPAAAR